MIGLLDLHSSKQHMNNNSTIEWGACCRECVQSWSPYYTSAMRNVRQVAARTTNIKRYRTIEVRIKDNLSSGRIIPIEKKKKTEKSKNLEFLAYLWGFPNIKIIQYQFNPINYLKKAFAFKHFALSYSFVQIFKSSHQ